MPLHCGLFQDRFGRALNAQEWACDGQQFLGNLNMKAMTLEAATQHVTTTDPRFEVTKATIRGVEYSVFKNAPLSVPELLLASREAQGNGAAEYLVYQDERWTYDAYCSEVNRMARALQNELGIGSGDKVAVAMRNYPELPILIMAICSIGAVVVFVNAWWTTEELEYALTDSGARRVFADGPRIERMKPLEAVLNLRLIGVRDGEAMTGETYTALRDRTGDDSRIIHAIDTDDDFAVMYSSGTTGHPKGVVLTHRGAVNAVYIWLMQAVMGPLVAPPEPDAPEALRSSLLVTTPLFHVTATHPVFLLSLPLGAKLSLMYKWDAQEAVRIIDREQVTRIVGVPTQSVDLMAAAKEMDMPLPSLAYLVSGGAKRPAAQVAKIIECFPNTQPGTGWGMTETNAIGMGMSGDEYVQRPGAVGRLYPPTQELKFLDEDGAEVPVGMLGEITVKSPSNMRCYLNKPEATAKVFQDGWLRTGDLGVIDQEGYVTILDRKKNIIIRGGENIACLDVEGAIHRHPDVIEACTFSVPDERLGEIVGACVHLRDGATMTPDALRKFLNDHIAAYKIPQHVWFTFAPLPRGATDKLDRRGLSTQCLKSLTQETP